MSKRKRTISNEDRLIRGIGQGVGVEYEPWIKIQDLASLGRVTREKGIKVPRKYEFLSDLEWHYFNILEFEDNVIDIREQFPLLPIEETIIIAEELGIKHPINRKTGDLLVMTTDFVVTKIVGDEFINIARTLKYQQELANRRVIEKFEIERVYWERKEIDWGILTENEIVSTKAKNIINVSSYIDLKEFEGFTDMEDSTIAKLISYLIDRVQKSYKRLREVLNEIELRFDLLPGSGRVVLKHLIAKRILLVDLSKRLNIDDCELVVNPEFYQEGIVYNAGFESSL